MQTELLKSQDKIVKEIIKKLKDRIVDKKIEKILLVQKADDTSGGITTTIKYIKPGYNKALFITWDISPTTKEDYIYRIEITEKFQQARPEIRLDKYYVDKDDKGNYPISNEIALFIDLN